MKSIDQALADASNDSYKNRSQGDIKIPKTVFLDGQKYQVFGYANDPTTGFHATAYRNGRTNDIIIAYRGTDPGLFAGATKAEKAGHALTTLQDIAVDAKMVRDTVNTQKAAADAFTAQMMAKAAAQGISKDHVFVTGHSLGGAVAEIEAARYGLRGSTYNGFGAADLIDGPPQPGCQLTNYRMAGDVVSAASPHIGEVVSLASQEDVQSLRAGRYLDAPAGAPPPNALIAMRLDDHGGQQHFNSKSPDNVLQPQRFQEAAQRYAQHKAAIDQFGSDVSRARAELSQSLRQMHGHGRQGDLSPNVQRQVNEYLAVNADPSIRDGIERNAPVQGAEHGLLYGAGFARATGRAAHDLDERVASAAREAGAYGAPVIPLAPLAGGVAGEAAHLHAQAADAAGRLVGDGLQSAKGAVEQQAHAAAEAVVRRIHHPGFQAGAANTVNHIVDTYDAARVGAQAAEQKYQDARHAVSQRIEHAENAAMHTYGAARHAVLEGVDSAERAATQTYDATRHAVSQGVDRAERAATQTYDATKQAVSRGIDAAGHSAGQAYDTLTHPGQWFQHDAPAHAPVQPHAPAVAHPHAQAPATPPGSGDLRHPSNAQRARHDDAGHAPMPAPAQPATDFRDPAHPGHAEFMKTLREVHCMEAGRGIASGPHSEKVAAALLVQGEREGLRISNVAMGPDGQAQGLQRFSAFDTPKTVQVDPRQAQSVEMQGYASQWAQLRSPHLVSQARPAERTAEQAQGIAALSASDQAMFARIRQDVPAHLSDAHVAQAMLAAKQAGIDDAGKIDRVQMAGEKLWVSGPTPGFRAATDMSQPPAPMQDTLQQAQALNQQREQQLALEVQQRQQEGPGGRGVPVMG
ncbi:hypothetical protein NRY95_06185 [Xanthomonas campestris pv. phormiicola]|nr:hypothetical protein [Xanthomonas campestris pv. phormiicola]UYC17544.1 hypothetical protein NRY95_06185 [Xanthomonas campestris pv. phormiicola]